MRRLTAVSVTACALLIGAFAVPSAARAQAARPSFNCGAAKSDAERMICRDATLARLDREIAAAYTAALRRIDAQSAAKLREEQGRFVRIRDAIAEPDYKFDKAPARDRLRGSLIDRRDFLRLIRRPVGRQLITGTWRNYMGNVVVKALPPRRYEIEATSVDQYAARWVCEASGIAASTGNGLMIDERNNGGSELRFVREGDAMTVRERLKQGSEVTPHCGYRGSLEGTYFYVGT